MAVIAARGLSVAPLSFQQEHIWRSANRASHNIPPLAVRLIGALDVRVLERALDGVIRRHATLRTCVRDAGDGRGRAEQVVLSTVTTRIPVVDISHMDARRRLARAHALIRAQARLPFQLSAAPLMRVGLTRLGHDDHVLWFVVHHIVADLWSMKLLLRELAQLYTAYERGIEPGQPEPAIQYIDYAVWQREQWNDATALTDAHTWLDQLTAPPVRLPRTAPGDEGEPGSAAGSVASMMLTQALTTGIRRIARLNGATPFLALLAAFQLLVSARAGQPQVVVDTLIANRDRAELEPLIGMFAGTAPLRADLRDGPPFDVLVTRLRDTCLRLFEHQHLTFRTVADAMMARDASMVPTRPTLSFALQKAPVALPQPGSVRMQSFVGPGIALFDRSDVDRPLWEQAWQVWEAGDALQILVAYQTDRFHHDSVQRLLRDFAATLTAVVSDPRLRTWEIPGAVGALRSGCLVGDGPCPS